MDNHPIPQDVTGFQFKLVGNMTIKQFCYVFVGVVLAVFLYYLPLQSTIGVLVKIFFIPLLGASGFMLAFLPIEGRSIDVILGNFIKALFAPNQYVYHKTGRLFDFTHLPVTKPVRPHQQTTHTNTNINKAKALSKLLQTTHVQKLNKLDEKEAAFLQAFSASAPLPSPTLLVQQQQIVNPAPQLTPPSRQQADQPIDETPSSNHKQELSTPMQPKQIADSLAQQEHQLSQQLQQAKQDEQSQQTTGDTSAAHQKVTLLERQVQALHFQRQQLEQELAHLQNQLAQQQATSKTPLPTKQPASTSNVAGAPVVAQGGTTQSQNQQDLTKRGLPHIPDTPNVIVGVVKDPRGNVLPNILVEVKDKDGNPVRAFKTNNLGQFASATPLASGNYTVELEDPKQQNRFDIIRLAASNQILLPIEIVSHDAREELRKQLFN